MNSLNTLPRRVNDLIDHRYGRLEVIEFSHLIHHRYPNGNSSGTTYWRCRCECGSIKVIRGGDLRSGKIKSCGCLHRESSRSRIRKQNYKHGHTVNNVLSSEYRCWIEFRRRCVNKDRHDYKNYGGRGITVCDRWRNSFPNFLADMGRKPSPELSIDRIDNEGNYEPGNCRWATAKQQRANRRDK